MVSGAQLARMPVVVVLFLVASVATASAQCAWVMWGTSLSQTNVWLPVAGFETRAECITDVQTRQPRVKDVGALVCLPDTVDPCGPKGR